MLKYIEIPFPTNLDMGNRLGESKVSKYKNSLKYTFKHIDTNNCFSNCISVAWGCTKSCYSEFSQINGVYQCGM